MKKGIIPSMIFLMLSFYGNSQTIEVPSRMECVGIELHFTEALRKEIQTEVNALSASPKYFQVKLERAQQYFPIIERIFREEGVPDDIKYLALQESALIADAVSSANAVGFWQLKEPAANEVGLKINSSVDERMNIVSATQGAARYLKTNNFYYHNWLYAVLSYNTGRGGAESYVDQKYFGAKKMDLGKETHWYLRKFLAHKILFEYELSKMGKPDITLTEYTRGGGKTLNQIARELNIDPDELALYNKWLKSNRIPEDKTYVVIVPGSMPEKLLAQNTPSENMDTGSNPSPNSSEYPIIKEKKDSGSRIERINGLPGIIGNNGDDIQKLAELGGIPISKFVKINDITLDAAIDSGQVYYFRPKHNKAREYYHTVLNGQSLWQISQKYGVKLKKLLLKNRLAGASEIRPGMVLWIRYIRPPDVDVRYVKIPQEPATQIVENKGNLKKMRSLTDSLKINPVAADTLQQPLPLARPEQIVNTREEDTTGLTENADNQVTIAESKDSIESASPLFHVVEKGETLYAISKKYKIPIDSLIRINDLPEDASIQIGQQLYLKEPLQDIVTTVKKVNNGEDSYIQYEVRKGDTMYSIARKFNVTLQELQLWNNKSTTQLKIGENLKILKRN